MKEKSNYKKLPMSLKITLIAVLVAALCFLYMMFSLYSRAKSLGDQVGGAIGGAEGSLTGGVAGYHDGTDDGKNDGLNANDVTASIENEIVLSGDFQVQTSSFEYVDTNRIGSDSAILTRSNATITYSVNLSNAEVSYNEKKVTVTLDKIIGSISVGDIDQLDSWFKAGYTGSTQGALTAANKSEEDLRKAIETELENSPSNYNEKVKKVACEQVSALVKNMLVSKRDVEVIIKEKAISYE